jgi:hypothetical protein
MPDIMPTTQSRRWQPDIGLNPASFDLGGREKVAGSVKRDIERNLKRRTGRAIQRRVQSNR